jgi:acyl carrier protein
MKNDELLNQLFELLRNKNENFSDYKLNEIYDKPLNELGMDSLGLVSFMVHIEDEFGIEWDEDNTNTEVLRTLQSMKNYIQKELGYVV